MTKQEMVESLRRTAARATKLADALEAGLAVRVRDGFAGHPKSPTIDAGQSTSGRPADDDPQKPKEYLRPELRGVMTHSDPTGAAAVQALNYGDRGKQDAKTLGRIIKAADMAMGVGEEIEHRYSAHPPSAVDAATGVEDAGCQSCARIKGPSGKSDWWNPVALTTTLTSGAKVDLCDWCWRGEVGVKHTGHLPDVLDIASHRDNGRARKRSA